MPLSVLCGSSEDEHPWVPQAGSFLRASTTSWSWLACIISHKACIHRQPFSHDFVECSFYVYYFQGSQLGIEQPIGGSSLGKTTSPTLTVP